MDKTIDLIKKLYETRDINAIEDVYHAIYGMNPRPILIGTSNAELYFNKENIIKLFKADLESWGDVFIDQKSMTIKHLGPFQVVNVQAKIRQTFQVTDETYQDFSSYIEEIRHNKVSSDYQKVVLVQQLLSHLLSDRPQGTRIYDWDLDIDFIVKNNQAFLMMFSMPINDLTPDVRLDDFDDYNKKIYQRELELIEPEASIDQYETLISLVKDHIKTLKQVSQVFMNSHQIICESEEDYVSFAGIGYYTKKVTLDKRLKIILANFYETEEPKRKLFNIRRDISNHLLHDAIGEEMSVQFRVIGIAKKIDDSYKIEVINISLPFNLILEEKTDDHLIKEDVKR